MLQPLTDDAVGEVSMPTASRMCSKLLEASSRGAGAHRAEAGAAAGVDQRVAHLDAGAAGDGDRGQLEGAVRANEGEDVAAVPGGP